MMSKVFANLSHASSIQMYSAGNKIPHKVICELKTNEWTHKHVFRIKSLHVKLINIKVQLLFLISKN